MKKVTCVPLGGNEEAHLAYESAVPRVRASPGQTHRIAIDGARRDGRVILGAEAGVVYANRPTGATTGAWPGVQSFCGWKASGSSGKGGCGPYDVAQFLREQSRTIVR